MTPDDLKRLEEIEGREKAASPGPWKAEIWHGNDGGFAAVGPVHLPADGYEDEWESPDDKHGQLAQLDANFMASAREDVPWLIAKVRELEEEVEKLRDMGPGVTHEGGGKVSMKMRELPKHVPTLHLEFPDDYF